MPTQKTRKEKKRNFSSAFGNADDDHSAALKKIKTDQDLMKYILSLRQEFNKKLDTALQMYKFKDPNVL